MDIELTLTQDKSLMGSGPLVTQDWIHRPFQCECVQVLSGDLGKKVESNPSS